MKALVAMAAAFAAVVVAAPSGAAEPETVLFIGNSFTFGANSAAMRYRADSVEDLNGDGIGGVPALFKRFTEEAGLDYRVSLETSPGKTLKWHWENRRERIDRAWDHVVMQELSVLDYEHPGDPTVTIDYAGRLATMMTARNPKVDVSMTATWTRPDQTYRPEGHWYGKPVTQMALDLRRGYDAADAASDAIDRVNPVGQAFNCAIAAGFADPNPYDGIAYDQLDLWSYDHYHASIAGYYLEALVVFAGITGKDPRVLGKGEQAARDLGLSGEQAVRLQRAAAATVLGQDCAALGASAE
ncbi:MAG TPA: PEP-CTERM sorting domain-containing protein [Sphingomonas sp.]|nr:PEP-CTERM sorting domain-containing protein [Sphingomonas sp.]